MTTELLKAALVWKARPQGGYASGCGRFAIEKRGADWGLIEAKKTRVRLFSTVRDAKAGAEWVVARPAASLTNN
jgi:hypothetical protein